MKITELVDVLNQKGVSLKMVDGQLKVKADKGVLDAALIAELRDKKAALIDLLFGVKTSSYFIPQAPERPYYRVTPSQYRLWVSANLGAKKAYNIPFSTEIFGKLQVDKIGRAMHEVIKRHASIRTVFRFDADNVLQQFILSPETFNFEFEYQDIRREPELEDDCLQEVIATDFDLENGPLIRAGVIHRAEEEFVLFICIHHTVSDGWSMEVLFNDLIQHYQSFYDTGKAADLAPLDIQYSDFAVWLNENLEEINNKESSFWVNRFREEIPLLKLPFEKGRPAKKTYVGGTVQYNGTRTYNNMIKDFCKSKGCTTFAFAVAAYKVLLYKYSGLTDLTIGSPISGRVNSQLENQVGLYINTIPIRSRFSEEQTFYEVLRNEHENIKLSHDNQLFSMDDLLKRLDIQTPIGHSPIFDIMMAYQNQTTLKMYNSDNISEIEVRPAPGNGPNIPFAQFDLGLGMGEYKDEIIVTAQYNSDVYEALHIEGMMDDYIFLMEALINRSQVSIETFLAECEHEFVTDREIVFTTLRENDAAEELSEQLVAAAAERGPENPHLKRAIQTIIQKYVAGLPAHEDYFAKGGNSLGAIQAINDINKTFKTRLSIIDFYNNASINKMHDLMYADFTDWRPEGVPEPVPAVVQAPSATEPADFVLEYGRARRDLPSLFLFPPIVGTGLVFRPLAKDPLVQEEFNAYAFDLPLVRTEERIMEAVADTLYEQVKSRLYNAEPVYLVGYSVGVHPAFEVARRLERDGRQAVLLMLDRGRLAVRPQAFEGLYDPRFHHRPSTRPGIDQLGQQGLVVGRHPIRAGEVAFVQCGAGLSGGLFG
ncbi:MAG: condensation domain-containing protein, partial [Bacteroidota bacterium]